jgi:uncharacterized protein
VTTDPQLIVNVVDLRRKLASRQRVHVTALAGDDLVVGDASVPAGSELDVDVVLESLSDGITVTGQVSGPWIALCRRCLGPAAGRVTVEVRELYQAHPSTDEAFAFEGDLLDLAPLVREALMLDLPVAPVCRPACLGLCPVCGVDRNETACSCAVVPTDPRWSALDGLAAQLGQFDQPGT